MLFSPFAFRVVRYSTSFALVSPSNRGLLTRRLWVSRATLGSCKILSQSYFLAWRWLLRRCFYYSSKGNFSKWIHQIPHNVSSSQPLLPLPFSFPLPPIFISNRVFTPESSPGHLSFAQNISLLASSLPIIQEHTYCFTYSCVPYFMFSYKCYAWIIITRANWFRGLLLLLFLGSTSPQTEEKYDYIWYLILFLVLKTTQLFTFL